MAKESILSEDHLIPHAGPRAEQFLGVIQQETLNQGLGIEFVAGRRSMRDKTIVLRAPLKVGRAADLELEVWAEPQGAALHVGWSAQEKVADSWNAWGRDIQTIKQFGSNVQDAERKMRGMVQAFHNLVYQPVVQMLVEATQQRRTPGNDGFLGA